MKCPFCSATETKVVDKRAANDGETNRRRRECIKCSKRFTTYERIEHLGLSVIKKDGSIESFNGEKIRNGILKACEKRPIDEATVNGVVDWIEKKVKSKSSTKVTTKFIGELVMKKLRMLDDVAYLRFASVYNSFNDIRSFEKELKQIKNSR
jgi:transcriptional repressor NrdR